MKRLLPVRHYLSGKDLYDLFIVVFYVGEGAVRTDFHLPPVFFFKRKAPRTGFKRIERAVAEEAVDAFAIRHFMTGVVYTVFIFKIFKRITHNRR